MLYSVNFNKEQLGDEAEDDSPYYLENVEQLSLEKLISLMKEKEIVKIVSCYYGIESLNKMLRALRGNSRQTDIVISAVGLSKENWIAQINMLLDEKNGLCLGNHQNVYLYTKFSLLHSKIYFSKSSRFKESARGAKCLVGSANLSSNAFNCNEEILAEILDDETKNSIEKYIDAILNDTDSLYSLRDLISKKKKWGKNFDLSKEIGCPEDTKSIIKFISSGYLFFQSRRNFSLGFSDNEFREETKDKQVENTTNGQIFIKNSKSLDVSAILGLSAEEDDESQELINNESKRISIRSNSVETCFGYWVPEERYEAVTSLIFSKDEDETAREKKYNQIYEALKLNEKSLSEEANRNLRTAFTQAGLLENRFSYYQKKVLKHIKSKRIYYENNKELYVKNCFCITPMPNIFEDPVATTEFIDSLWGDICDRCNYTGVEKRQDLNVLCRKLFSLFVDNNSSEFKMKRLTEKMNDLPY